MTPKSLLRNKYCVSYLEDFNKKNSFHRVLWDHAIDPKSKGFIKLKESSKIKKVILCSGKVYFDLLDAREKLKRDDVVMFRIEQFILWHYQFGSKYDTPFWNYAKTLTFKDADFNHLLKTSRKTSWDDIIPCESGGVFPTLSYAYFTPMSFKYWEEGMISRQ